MRRAHKTITTQLTVLVFRSVCLRQKHTLTLSASQSTRLINTLWLCMKTHTLSFSLFYKTCNKDGDLFFFYQNVLCLQCKLSQMYIEYRHLIRIITEEVEQQLTEMHKADPDSFLDNGYNIMGVKGCLIATQMETWL